MTADVIAWLESPDSDGWRRANIRPMNDHRGALNFARILPDPGDDGTPLQNPRRVDAAYDPCGPVSRSRS